MKSNPKAKGGHPAPDPPSPPQATKLPSSPFLHKHLKWGWWSLLVFLTMGFVIEILHGFKVGAYLDVSNTTRRLMWTLSHAHGTLLALVHIAFAVTTPHLPATSHQKLQTISRCFIAAGILIPVGFFLGGAITYGGDPGLGIFLLPIGAFTLFLGVLFSANRLSH
ncbi:MAG: hypothetical protein ACFHW5_21325 [Verrucomicrobiota bacterium]